MFLVSSGTKLEISVAMYPGETVLARAKRTHSTERDLPEVGVSLIHENVGLWCIQRWTTPDLAALYAACI